MKSDTSESMSPAAGTSSWPSVAVIVPAFNEERDIGRCLESLKNVDYPRDRVEIIVVDNGSTDRTPDIVSAADVRLEIIPDVKVGAVRNGGVKRSRGEYIAFIDADCVAPSTWLKAVLAELIEHPETGAAGGTYLVEQSASWIERAWALRPYPRRREEPYVVAGSLAMKREVFEQLGGFAESLSAGEDEDLCRRIRQAGYRIVTLPGAAVYHLGFPRSLREVFRRQRWQGSNQLESARSWLDRAVLAVHAFVAALLAAIVLVGLGQFVLAALCLGAALIGLPLLAGLNRKTQVHGLAEQIARPFQLWVIFVFFFFGRATGLFLNYRNRLLRTDRKYFK